MKVKELTERDIEDILHYIDQIFDQCDLIRSSDFRQLMKKNGVSCKSYKGFTQEFDKEDSPFRKKMRKERRIFGNSKDEYFFVSTKHPNCDGLPWHIGSEDYNKMWLALEAIYNEKEVVEDSPEIPEYPTDPTDKLYTNRRFEFIGIIEKLNELSPKSKNAIKMSEEELHKALSDDENVIKRFIAARNLGAFQKFLHYRPVNEEYDTADYIVKKFTQPIPLQCKRENECISPAMVYDCLNL